MRMGLETHIHTHTHTHKDSDIYMRLLLYFNTAASPSSVGSTASGGNISPPGRTVIVYSLSLLSHTLTSCYFSDVFSKFRDTSLSLEYPRQRKLRPPPAKLFPLRLVFNLPLCVCECLSLCLSVSLSVYLSVSLCVSVCVSVSARLSVSPNIF